MKPQEWFWAVVDRANATRYVMEGTVCAPTIGEAQVEVFKNSRVNRFYDEHDDADRYWLKLEVLKPAS